MRRSRKKRSGKKLFGALALLVLIAAMLPLGAFLSGVLSGGGRRDDPDRPDRGDGAAGTLRITVLQAADGKPVAGARILVSGLMGGESGAVSDPDGRATLEGLGSGPVRVEASYEGQQAVAWADPRSERELLLAVAPARLRRGVVRLADGRPARATVRLMGEAGAELDSAETDPAGRYEMPDQADALSICVEAEGAAPAVASRGDVALSKGELLEGRLLGAGPGELSVHGIMQSPDDDAMLAFRTRWPVGAGGRFMGRLRKGVVAWAVYDGLPLRLKAGEIELPERTTARGSVARHGNTPAGRAVLLFRPLLDSDFPVPLPGLRVEADDRGRFEATGFADVRYAVEVHAPGCATRVVSGVRPGAGAIEIALEPGYAVGGFVVDARGLPVANAQVRAVGFPDPKGERPVVRWRADARGSFFLHGLGGEYARIRVTAEGFHPTTLDGVRAVKDLRVVLQRR